MSILVQELVNRAKELEARLPPHPWEADIDDPHTANEEFTGKFYHPGVGSLCLYNEPQVARDIAEMRTIIHLLATL